MSRCIELAKNGLGTTYPNPLVGSVLVYNNLIIGEGWHYKAGKAHAEVHAITNSKTKKRYKGQKHVNVHQRELAPRRGKHN